MAPRVLIVHPPVSVGRDFIDYPWVADLGAVQLAAVMRSQTDVALVDACALPGSSVFARKDGRVHLGAELDEVLACVRATENEQRADLAVISFTPFHRPPARDDILGGLLQEMRRLLGEAPILLADCYQSGQHYVEADAARVLASYPEASAWVKYEAEVTVPKLASSWLATRTPPTGVHAGEPPSLDLLAPPAWDLIDLQSYQHFHARVMSNLGRGSWPFPIDGRTLPMVTSRGCPFTCMHCSSNPGRQPGAPKIQRRLSPSRLGDLCAAMTRQHGATRLLILDEMLNANAEHFEHLLSTVEALGVLFDVPNGLRADRLTAEHLARMKGRVTTVSVSAESGVDRIVNEVIGKRLDLASVRRTAENAQAANVPLMVHYMIGLPGESAQEINETLRFALDLYDRHGAMPALQFATPLPGTAIARTAGEPEVADFGPCFQARPLEIGSLVSASDLVRFKWTFDQRLAASRGPQKLILNLTYQCNNHCVFCAVGNRTRLHGDTDRQRDHLLAYRRRGVRMVDFDGGEPTLHPDLIPLIRYAAGLEYERIHITTNGRLCAYEQFTRTLVRSGLTSILFSLHGPDAGTHGRLVGAEDAFDQTTRGIRNAVLLAPPEVVLGMNTTITKENCARLLEIVELSYRLGLRWHNLQFLTPFGRATKDIAPDTQQAAEQARRVIDAYGDRMKVQIINLPFCFLPGYEQQMVGDLSKFERHMVFVNNEDVNLSQYLATRRVRRPVCNACPHAIFCAGFYELDDAPDPPWIVTAEDAKKPIPSA
jgi:MoaA/NifB/PqqE/SkfB family radical SAM enzyme